MNYNLKSRYSPVVNLQMTEVKSTKIITGLIVIASVISVVTPFSYSRLLNDINQDVAEQTDFDSLELKNSLSELAESSKTQVF